MKKLLLSLGTIAAVATPVGAVIACGPTSDIPSDKELAFKLSQYKSNDITKLHDKDLGLSETEQKVITKVIQKAEGFDELKQIMSHLDEYKTPVVITKSQAQIDLENIIDKLKDTAKNLVGLNLAKLSQDDMDALVAKISTAKNDTEIINLIEKELVPNPKN